MKKVLLAVAAVILIAGQFIILKKPLYGGILSGIAVILAAAAFIKPDKESAKIIINNCMLLLFPFCGMAGILLSRTGNKFAFVFYILAAVFLLLGSKGAGRIMREDRINAESDKPGKLEILFFVVLVVILFITRMALPGQYPNGSTGHESEMAMECPKMENNFTAHSYASDVSFPSLIFYQGIAFSKVFGFNSGSLRIPSGIWGVLGIISFYFLVRLLFSAQAAVFASLLFAGSNLHLIQSRWFFPGTILIPAILAAFAFVIYGIRYRKTLYFLLGGFALGFALHGYFPGRGAPFIFAVWLTAAVILWKRYEIKPKHVIAFFAGMIITALPVIIFAFMKPDVYFQYFNHANPNKGGAVLGYLQTISRNLMYYVKMFSVQSDGDYSIHIDDAPLLDDVTGIFFPAAFFISLIFFFRPSQMFMLLVFFAGMLPALLGGGGFAHPTERRVIMALPAIYLFSAMALDLIRSGLMEKGFKKTWTAVFSILIIAAFIVAGNTGIKFFFKYSGSPYETIGYGRMYKEAGDFLRANKKLELYASPRLKSDVAEFMTMPHELPVNYCVSYEDALKTAPEKGFAIAADGYFVYTQGIFNEIYGNPFFKAHKEKFLDSKLMKHWVYGLKTEPYFVGNYLTTISVSPEQSKSTAGMMVIKEGGMTAEKGTFFSEGGSVKIKAPAGSSIRIDGKRYGAKEAINLIKGAHLLEVLYSPENKSTEISSVSAYEGERELPAVKLTKPYGLTMCLRDGMGNTSGSCLISSSDLFPMKRFYQSGKFPHLSTAVFKGYITVPENGEYTFKTKKWDNKTQFFIDGKMIFSNVINGNYDKIEKIYLEKGNKYIFEAVLLFEMGEAYRVFFMEYTSLLNPEGVFKPVPAEWFFRY